jgi:mono/diheme cytochrome c family protein
MHHLTRIVALPLCALVFIACGGDAEPDANGDEPSNGLTAFEEEHGIGPFTVAVTLEDPIDPEKAEMGQHVFEANCEACHMLDESFVGPELGTVLDRRSPTFVLNMIMNPEEMTRRHPVVQEMLREYPLIMPYQNISEEEALAILEYLRTVH